MEKVEKNKVTNINQFQKLVEELEKNPSLAVGFRRGTIPCNFKANWEEIATELNALGPPRRLADGWLKVWRDLKFKVKKKMVANKAECNSTGGGIFKQFTLSPLEESVANLLQFQKQLNPDGKCYGVQQQTQEESLDLLHILNTEEEAISATVDHNVEELPLQDELPECSAKSIMQKSTPKKKENRVHSKGKEEQPIAKKKCNCVREEMLENHSNQQAKLLTGISNSLLSLKRSNRELEKYQKQLLDIEKKKLKLLEEKNDRDEKRSKREEEMHESEMEIKRIKIIIKQKELQFISNNQGK